MAKCPRCNAKKHMGRCKGSKNRKTRTEGKLLPGRRFHPEPTAPAEPSPSLIEATVIVLRERSVLFRALAEQYDSVADSTERIAKSS